MTNQIPGVYQSFVNPQTRLANESTYVPNPLKTNAPVDTYTPSNKTEKQDKNKKWKILGAIGGIVVGGIAAAGLIYRCRFRAVKQLAEHITFKPAKTMLEAKQYAAQNLKIKKFDLGDDVGLANWVNEGLTKVSNLYKGRAYLPAEVKLLPEFETGAAAAMSQGLNSKKMTNTLYINGKYFSQEEVAKRFKNAFNTFCPKSGDSRSILSYPFIDYGTSHINKIIQIMRDGDRAIIPRFTGNAISRNAFSMIEYGQILKKTPMVIVKDLYEQQGVIDLIKSKTAAGTFKELSELEKLPKEKVIRYIGDVWHQLKKTIPAKDLPKSRVCPANYSNFSSILHELGHANHERSAMFKYAKMHVGYEATNPTIGKIAKGFVESPTEQLIASTVSEYAKHSPLEFVAEVYSRVLEGRRFGDDVMNLYKKYKGPALPIQQ